MKETWTDIPGLEGKYQISNMGRYKRLGRREHVYDIADSMGISGKTISKIKSGRSYAWAK